MLEGIPVAALGPAGLLVLAAALPYIQMARGKLVPRSSLDDERDDTAEWRAAHRISEDARAQYAEQTKELLANAEATLVLLRSITERAEK